MSAVGAQRQKSLSVSYFDISISLPMASHFVKQLHSILGTVTFDAARLPDTREPFCLQFF